MTQESSTIQTGKRRAGRYRQVTAAMRERILRGEYKPGMLLPTMHELADQYDTSFFTVQTALKPLEEEGVIEKKKRVGKAVMAELMKRSDLRGYRQALGHLGLSALTGTLAYMAFLHLEAIHKKISRQ